MLRACQTRRSSTVSGTNLKVAWTFRCCPVGAAAPAGRGKPTARTSTTTGIRSLLRMTILSFLPPCAGTQETGALVREPLHRRRPHVGYLLSAGAASRHRRGATPSSVRWCPLPHSAHATKLDPHPIRATSGPMVTPWLAPLCAVDGSVRAVIAGLRDHPPRDRAAKLEPPFGGTAKVDAG